MTGEQSEAAAVVGEIEALVQKAAAVPLTDQVRIGRQEIDALLDRLRTALSGGSSGMTALFDELEALVQRAKSVPGTNQIRIERAEIYDVLDRMRMTLADSARRVAPSAGPPEVAAVMDELDQLVERAKPIPLTTQVRIDRIELYTLLDRMREALGRVADDG